MELAIIRHTHPRIVADHRHIKHTHTHTHIRSTTKAQTSTNRHQTMTWHMHNELKKRGLLWGKADQYVRRSGLNATGRPFVGGGSLRVFLAEPYVCIIVLRYSTCWHTNPGSVCRSVGLLSFVFCLLSFVFCLLSFVFSLFSLFSFLFSLVTFCCLSSVPFVRC